MASLCLLCVAAVEEQMEDVTKAPAEEEAAPENANDEAAVDQEEQQEEGEAYEEGEEGAEEGEEYPEEEAQNEAEGAGAPLDEDVVHTFEGHYFTKVDEKDVVKIQSIYRRHRDAKSAEEKRKELKRRETEAETIAAQPVAPIELPEEEYSDPNDRKKSEAVPSKFRNVDYSRIHVQPMSADAKGMQKMYSRMLTTKMWW